MGPNGPVQQVFPQPNMGPNVGPNGQILGPNVPVNVGPNGLPQQQPTTAPRPGMLPAQPQQTFPPNPYAPVNRPGGRPGGDPDKDK